MFGSNRVLAFIVGFAAALQLTLAAAEAAASGVAPAAAAHVSAPVIHERFTALPCTGQPANRTTVQQLGCAEQAVLRGDKRIDAESKTVFSRLADDPARRRFVAGARAWLSYRNADCTSRADAFEGGTQGPVVAAQCMAARNQTRLADLRAFARQLSHPAP
jgi:uncharacterized protein YecT (DUF1311 family)